MHISKTFFCLPRSLWVLLAAVSCAGFLRVERSHATIFFEFDGESGYQYMGAQNLHTGGGYFSWMGGSVSDPAGTNPCDRDITNFHYTVLASEEAAQTAVSGSRYALKTPYSAGCSNESFLRDTTVISVPVSTELYVRWYQKWTGDWMSGDVQQKFAKFYTNGQTEVAQFSFPPFSRSWRALVPNLEGHFDKDGITRYPGQIWVTASSTGGYYLNVNRSYDDDPNTTNFDFETDRWYCIEIHFKINSQAETPDALIEAWVDGSKVMGIYEFKMYNSLDNPLSVNALEFQHVYYNRTPTDQPTYMDNIIIADSYIGPLTRLDTDPPVAPLGLSVR